MAEEVIKQRLNRAIKAAIRILEKPSGHCRIIEFKDSRSPFHIECIRKNQIRMIRIVLDKISEMDIKALKEFRLPMNCYKEIWCKKVNEREFEYKEII